MDTNSGTNNPVFTPMPITALQLSDSHGTKHGLRVTFKDVSFTTKSKNRGKQLLNQVSGFMEEQSMTALLGPSGAGKSTLLNVLSGRMRGGTISGEILFAGIAPSAAFLRRYTGYVEQFDVLIPALTIRETLMYTAELKCPRSKSYADKARDVEVLIRQLALQECADTRVGRLSGGESKRTNIGISMVAEPVVLWLDEPSSGLDSHSANEVVQVLQGLARNGITVVSTIHSPSAQAFAMFDRLILLAGGQIVFFGPQGDIAVQFARQFWPGADEQEMHCSAAEFLVDQISTAHRAGHSQLLANIYKDSDLCKENAALLQTRTKQPKSKSVSEAIGALLGRKQSLPSETDSDGVLHVTAHSAADLQLVRQQTEADELDKRYSAMVTTHKSTATPTWWGIWVLLKYRARRNYMDPYWVGARLLDKITFGIIVVTLYWGIGDSFAQDNLTNLAASLFLWAALPAYSAITYMPAILTERKLHYREHADGLYHVHTYFIAKLIEEITLCSLFSIGISSFVFFGVRYQGNFVFFWLVYLLNMSVGVAIGYVIAAFSPTLEIATAILPGYVTTLLFFSGQVMTFDSIPKYWEWYSRIDFLRYAWTGLMVNQFHQYNPVATPDGTTMLQYYSIVGVDMWNNLYILVAFFFGYAFLAYLGLVLFRFSTR